MIAANELDLIKNQKIKAYINMAGKSVDSLEKNPVADILRAEGCEDFLEYIYQLGLNNDPNMVVLSSQHHYYYDDEEMKNVGTVINLKELNQVKEIKSFLESISYILPQNSNFIGCFVDNKKVNGYELRSNSSSSDKKINYDDLENGIVSHIPFVNMIYSFMDLKINKYLSERSVEDMLEEIGFKVLNMKEINGLTYFHSQKTGSTEKII